MRKRISFLLSLIMLFSMCPIEQVYAAPASGIDLKYLEKVGIQETEEGLVEAEISKEAEEATLEWSIEEGAGKYELLYSSDTVKDVRDDTARISLGFEVGKDKAGTPNPNRIKVTASITDSTDTKKEVIVYKHNSPYKGTYTQIMSAPATPGEYVEELSMPSAGQAVAVSAEEMSLKIGNNLLVRMKTDGKTIKLWTNEINKGYITDFELWYDGTLQDTERVFPGLAGVKISSVHLNGDLVDRTTPIDASSSTETDYAGSRPGVKVEFSRPMVRDVASKKYVPISGSEAEKVKVALNLQTKLEPDNTVQTNQKLVEFDLSGNGPVTGDNIPSGKRPELDGNTMALYFLKDESYSGNSVHAIEWPALEESMVIGGSLTLSGSVQSGSSQYQIMTGNVALPTGYTYLRYVPEQTNPGEVTLQVTPYKYKGKITYEVYAVNGKATNNIATSNCLFGTYNFTYDPSEPERKLQIPMPTGAESTFMIKAILAKESTEAVSQKVYYNINGDNVVVKPYTPQIKEINKIYVIPEGETGVEAAGFTMTWRAPKEEKLKETLKDGKTLYYELTLYDGNKANKAIIAIYKMQLDGTQIKATQVGRSNGEVIYDRDNEQFMATNVILKDIEHAYWEKISLPNYYENGSSYPTIDESSYVDGLTYRIPSSFYLTMRTVLDSGTTLITSATESEVYPLTLDKTTEVVPAPSVFSTVKKTDSTDLTFNFENVSVKNFADLILTPANWYLKGSTLNMTLPGSYEIYLYQANYLEGNTSKKNDMTDGELLSAIKTNDTNKLYLINETLQTTPAALSFTTHHEALDALRSGKIVGFTMKGEDLKGGTNSIDLKGLDPNQSYYVRIRTKLESERTKNGNHEERTDISLFSKIYGFTTTTVTKPVEPDEEVPPTPKEYTATARDNSSAILHWKDPDLTLSNNDKLIYEIIRTTEQQIQPDLLKRNVKASDIVSKESAKKAVLLDSSQYVKKDIEGNLTYELVDETLQPNTVYYYYIRTVYNGAASDWIYQPVTTANIEKPISLKAFNATKTTVDISFLAKVANSALYNTFDFGIAIQGGDSEEWKTISASSLQKITVANHETQEGYNYYAYRITDLIPGKRYNIKVCVIDKTKDQIDGKYQQSLYTDSVYIRTEYDQEQQDKEDKYEEYLDKFDKEVEKLRRKAYWTVEDGTTYKYRADYLKADMGLNKEYTLVSDERSNEAYYYLPASVLTQMNDNGTILKVQLGNEEVAIRPDTITNDHELIKEAAQLIDANKLEDYYLAIRVKKSNYSGQINGEDTVSPKIDISMSLTYMRQEDILTEADIMEALEDIIKTKRETFISKLETKINKGKLEDDVLQEIIDDVLADVEDRHISKVSKIMDRQVKKTIKFTTINKAMLITHTGDHAGVNAYYDSSNWISVQVYSMGSNFAIEAQYLGGYIFTGQKPLINTAPSVAPYQDFINKYQLTEFFTMDSYMLKVAVTKEQLYGAVAKVMGAKQGTDYVVYLNNKGIKGLSKLGLKNTVRQDESIYIIMQAYEQINNRKVASVKVKDKQGVQNIGAFQPIYRDYVYAAVELKVVTPVEKRVIPSKQMTGEEIIKMLYKIQY